MRRNTQHLNVGIVVCFLVLVLLIAVCYAAVKSTSHQALTPSQVETLLNSSHTTQGLALSATPEVVAELNRIYQSPGTRLYTQDVLKRMQVYLPTIKPILILHDVPPEFLALPFIESGYKMKLGNIKGLWQITSDTARKLGLTVQGKRDDRLNPSLDTNAAAAYLNKLYAEYHDWNLTLVAYNAGTSQTDALIKATGSRDMWVLARSPKAPSHLKPFLAKFTAAVIIISHPELVK